ncbi:MAG: DinB family protein [Tepidisphaeraceae bacterium]
MTLRDYLLQQYDYVIWADERCVAAAEPLTPEAYQKDFGFSFGCVHNVLVHMMGAQSVWLGRLVDGAERHFPTPREVPSLLDVRDRWIGVHDDFARYLLTLTDESLMETATYTRRGVQASTPRWMVLTHVFDHATYHRSQLNSLLKLAGGVPGDFSFQGRWRQAAGEAI